MESGSVDFCFSRMVMEHVDDVPALSVELSRVMGPGGVMVHEIGFQDHEDLSYIHFEFLKHSREEWAGMNKSTNLCGSMISSPCGKIWVFRSRC